MKSDINPTHSMASKLISAHLLMIPSQVWVAVQTASAQQSKLARTQSVSTLALLGPVDRTRTATSPTIWRNASTVSDKKWIRPSFVPFQFSHIFTFSQLYAIQMAVQHYKHIYQGFELFATNAIQ